VELLKKRAAPYLWALMRFALEFVIIRLAGWQ